MCLVKTETGSDGKQRVTGQMELFTSMSELYFDVSFYFKCLTSFVCGRMKRLVSPEGAEL